MRERDGRVSPTLRYIDERDGTSLLSKRIGRASFQMKVGEKVVFGDSTPSSVSLLSRLSFPLFHFLWEFLFRFGFFLWFPIWDLGFK